MITPKTPELAQILLRLASLKSPDVTSEVEHAARDVLKHVLSSNLALMTDRYATLSAEWRSEFRQAVLSQHPELADLLLTLDAAGLNDQSLLSELLAQVPADVLQNIPSVSSFFSLVVRFCGRHASEAVALSETNQILTLLVKVAVSPLLHADPQLACLVARTFAALMPHIAHNMAVPAESRVILDVLGSIARSPDPQVRTAGLQALLAVLEHYYDCLSTAISWIFGVHSAVLKEALNGPDTLASLDFWIALARHELDYTADQPCKHLVRCAAEYLLPIVLPLIHWHADDAQPDGPRSVAEFSDARNQRALALEFFSLLVQLAPDLVLKALRLVHPRLTSASWAQRASACDVFGAVFPLKSAHISDAAASLFFGTELFALLSDPVPYVAITAAWAVHQAVPDFAAHRPAQLGGLLQSLIDSLQTAASRHPSTVEWLCLAVARICDTYSSSPIPASTGARIAELGMVLLHQCPAVRPSIVDMSTSLIKVLPPEQLVGRLLDMYGQAAYSVTRSTQLATVDLWPLYPALASIEAIFDRHIAVLGEEKYATAALNLVISTFVMYSQSGPRRPQLEPSVEMAAIIFKTAFPLFSAAQRSQVIAEVLPLLQQLVDSLLNPPHQGNLLCCLLSVMSSLVSSPASLGASALSTILTCAERVCYSAYVPHFVKPHALNVFTDAFLAMGKKAAPFLPTFLPLLTSSLDQFTLSNPLHFKSEYLTAINKVLESIFNAISTLANIFKPGFSKSLAQQFVTKFDKIAHALIGHFEFDDSSAHLLSDAIVSMMLASADLSPFCPPPTSFGFCKSLMEHDLVIEIDHRSKSFQRLTQFLQDISSN